ncbi:MAG: class I adenylate-forming enzyme family protein [Myxococcota bacterium]
MRLEDHPGTLPVFLRRQAERFADRELMVLGERRIRYREAEAASGLLARGLLAAGVSKGAHVGVLMPNGPDWMLAWLAATRIGAVAVPINTFYRARELGWLLDHADIHTLLCVSGFLAHDYVEQLESCVDGLARQTSPALRLPTLPQLRSVFVWGECDRKWARDGQELSQRGATDPDFDAAFLEAVEARVAPSDPVSLIYSSGSTADPKGAIHTHGALMRHAAQLAGMRDLRTDDRIWTPMPFFWIGGLLFGLLGTIHHGACLVLEERFEPGRTLELLEREHVTVAAGWPHYARALADHPDFQRRDLSAIRGGNLYALEDRPVDPELRGNSLGMTETCGPHTYCEGEIPEQIRGSFGPPVPGLEHRIVDPETGETLPPGELGEICVRGYSLMQGLYKVEREQTFDADGFYHTGDLGYFDPHGHLYFRGRRGEMIKTGGANVTPLEVESTIARSPEVKQAHVVGLPDEERGEIVAAVVVLLSGAQLDEATLRARLKQELAAYKLPRRIFFAAPEQLPFTDSGKIDKRRLARLLAEWISERS